MRGWLSHPDQVDAKVAEWAERYPRLVSAEAIPQFRGRPVWAVTVTDKRWDEAGKRKVMVFKPHAHEPAPIAGQISIISMLLTGRTLDGRATEFDNERVLRRLLVTFILDANPEGTARAPVEAWDGSRFSNEELWGWMRGVDPDTGGMWKRVDLWDDRLEKRLPERYGIVYEQVSEHEYVEPNRHHRSTLFQWIFRLWERHPWDFMLDLHQTEFMGQQENCMVILPALFHDQPAHLRQVEMMWAERLVEAWAQIEGGRPIRSIEPLGYTGQEREYFVRCWGEFYYKVPILTSEVQNNSPSTPPWLQMRLNEVAIRETLLQALE